MYSVKINGISYDKVPESIEDLSIARFLSFRETSEDNPLSILQWAIDSKATIEHKENTESEIANVLSLLQPVINDIYTFISSQDQLIVPESINVMGLDIKLIGGLLNELPYWAYVVAKKLLSDEFKKEKPDPTSHIGTIVGHYIYSLVTKREYNEAKADTFAKDMADEIPMREGIQLGNFFLLKHLDLYPLKQRSSLRKLRKIMLRQV